MSRALLILIAVGLLAAPSHAEVPWCSMLGVTSSDKMAYPPVARSARIYGDVVGYIRFLPSGTVTGFDPVFGPPMLAQGVLEQVKSWTIVTDARDSASCRGLAIFKFSLDSPNPSQISSQAAVSSGILSVSIKAQPLVLDDPAVTVRIKSRFRLFHFLTNFK